MAVSTLFVFVTVTVVPAVLSLSWSLETCLSRSVWLSGHCLKSVTIGGWPENPRRQTRSEGSVFFLLGLPSKLDLNRRKKRKGGRVDGPLKAGSGRKEESKLYGRMSQNPLQRSLPPKVCRSTTMASTFYSGRVVEEAGRLFFLRWWRLSLSFLSSDSLSLLVSCSTFSARRLDDAETFDKGIRHCVGSAIS